MPGADRTNRQRRCLPVEYSTREEGGERVGNRGVGEEEAEGGRIHQNFDRTDAEGSFIERRKERERLVQLESHWLTALCVRMGEMGKPERKEETAARKGHLGERTFRCRTSRGREVAFEYSGVNSEKHKQNLQKVADIALKGRIRKHPPPQRLHPHPLRIPVMQFQITQARVTFVIQGGLRIINRFNHYVVFRKIRCVSHIGSSTSSEISWDLGVVLWRIVN